MSETTYVLGTLVSVSKTINGTFVTLRVDGESNQVTFSTSPEVAKKRLRVGGMLGLDIDDTHGTALAVGAHSVAKFERGIEALRLRAQENLEAVSG